jgi:hypothetical protein
MRILSITLLFLATVPGIGFPQNTQKRGVNVLVSLAQEQKPDKPKSLPEDRAADTYDVYDAALRSPIQGQPPYGAKYYIIDRAIKPNSSWHPEECLQPPDELRAKVREMLNDLAAQDTYTIEPRFKLDKPYEMVSFEHSDGFPASTDIIQLGVVSFSKDRSLASVAMWSRRGTQWKVFTRGKKGWDLRWSACGAVF